MKIVLLSIIFTLTGCGFLTDKQPTESTQDKYWNAQKEYQLQTQKDNQAVNKQVIDICLKKGLIPVITPTGLSCKAVPSN